MTVTDVQLDQARRVAVEAARRGRPIETCPYNANGTPDQRRLALAFVREYLDHVGDDVEYDADE
ncbi:hypothetical protein AB0B28_08180 [Glycomyces sp. NPDC046736]|uniref:hypothetical protein n=1 Tax=Glycomyces sp. NPDC046736 TaxID=3155615 RepID=UPI0033C28D19